MVAGDNYGQGSAREHAVMVPMYAGLRAVIAKSFARIYRQNLINFGVVPLIFQNKDDYDLVGVEDELRIDNFSQQLLRRVGHSRNVINRNTVLLSKLDLMIENEA